MGAHGVRVSWACRCCGKQMSTRPSQVGVTCSKACAMTLRPRKPSTIIRVCPVCRLEFLALVIHGKRKVTCSKTCDSERRAQNKAVAQLVRSEVLAIRRIGRKAPRSEVQRRACPGCGRELVRWTQLGRPAACSGCRVAAKASLRRKEHALKRARRRGLAVEGIDPFEVFEAAGWACAYCKCATPQRLRGKHEAASPELDHWMPVALGGGHQRSNLRCACRACNADKADKHPLVWLQGRGYLSL